MSNHSNAWKYPPPPIPVGLTGTEWQVRGSINQLQDGIFLMVDTFLAEDEWNPNVVSAIGIDQVPVQTPMQII
jgi:hypothetical protein